MGANMKHEEWLKATGKGNRYETQANWTYDFIVREQDLTNKSVEELLIEWLEKDILTGAIWVFHDKDRVNFVDNFKYKKPLPEGTPKPKHYHILVQFKEKTLQNEAWKLFGEHFFNKYAKNNFYLEYFKYAECKDEGDKPVPQPDAQGRVFYYLHTFRPEKYNYEHSELHQIGRLSQECKRKDGTIYLGKEININDERYTHIKGCTTTFEIGFEENILQEEFLEHISHLCELYNGSLYIEPNGMQAVLKTENPKTWKNVQKGLNMEVDTGCAIFPYDTINVRNNYSKNSYLEKWPTDTNVEDILGCEYLTFTKDKDKNRRTLKNFIFNKEREREI